MDHARKVPRNALGVMTSANSMRTASSLARLPKDKEKENRRKRRRVKAKAGKAAHRQKK